MGRVPCKGNILFKKIGGFKRRAGGVDAGMDADFLQLQQLPVHQEMDLVMFVKDQPQGRDGPGIAAIVSMEILLKSYR